MPVWLRTQLLDAFSTYCSSDMDDPLLIMPRPRLGFFQENEDASSSKDYSDLVSASAEAPHNWGLLLPVCCRETQGADTCFERLKLFVASIKEITTVVERQHLRVFLVLTRQGNSSVFEILFYD